MKLLSFILLFLISQTFPAIAQDSKEEVYVDPFAPVDLSKFEVKEGDVAPNSLDAQDLPTTAPNSADPFAAQEKIPEQRELSLEERALKAKREIEEAKLQQRDEILRDAMNQQQRQKEACNKSVEECLKEEALKRLNEI